MLPVYRTILKEEELALIAGMNEVDEYRWITSFRRVDWNKFFNNQIDINDLIIAAARSVPGNPIGFLRPDWVDCAIQRYKTECPQSVIVYANSFKEATQSRNIFKMRQWYSLIKTMANFSR